MLSAITYRGPDQSDVEINEDVAFGHNRLTIIEPTGGRQPRSHPETASSLIYNGEIYSYRKFDGELAAAGYTFRDHCDTETFFWLIAKHGVSAAVRMVDGMFAIAHHDATTDTVCLARDRFGQKPLFYSVANGELIFASEIKALLRHPSLSDCTADVDALSLYLMMEYVPGGSTGLQGIRELPPGHILSWSNGQLEVTPYWQPSNVTRQPSIDERDAQQQLDSLLGQAVEDQLIADVPVGIFLSGGLDSSLIAALARRHHQDVATFTIKFPQASFDESEFAADVAQQIGTRHTTIRLGKQSCVDGLEQLLAQIDQPFGDSSLLPTYLLCQATRQHVKVALGGDGADELLLGYANFRALRFARLMQHVPAKFGKALEWIAGKMPTSLRYMDAAFLLRQFSYGIGMPADMQSIYWMSAIAARDQDELWIDDGCYEQRIFEQVSEQIEAHPEQSLMGACQQHFLNSYLPYDILQKTDRASMYSSLEVRAPFLSSNVADHALSLPYSSLFENGHGKQILRSVAKNYLPASIISRPKHGFALPISSMIREDLRDVVEPVLLDPSNPMYGHLQHKKVAQLWSQHLSQRADHGKKLWALLMLATFFRNTLQAS